MLGFDKDKKLDSNRFMLKEIFEQPESLANLLNESVDLDKVQVKFKDLDKFEKKLKQIKRIIIIGSGSSWHAGLVAKSLIQELAKIPVQVEYASEFVPIIEPQSLVIVISQSGESIDSLAALRLAKGKKALSLSISNVIDSSIAKLADISCDLKAGPEVSLPATKTFSNQLGLLTGLAIYLGSLNKKLKKQNLKNILKELVKLPELIKGLLNKNDDIISLAKKYKGMNNFLYLGSGYNYPIALEGALKLKEAAYVHAEGYPIGELRHGPIALVDKNLAVLFIISQDKKYDETIRRMNEVKNYGGKVIVLTAQDDKQISQVADNLIYIPKSLEMLMPILNVIPLQLLAYHTAVLKGLNADKPRNLTKSVRVE